SIHSGLLRLRCNLFFAECGAIAFLLFNTLIFHYMQRTMKSKSVGNNSTYTNPPTNGGIFRLSTINPLFEQKDNPPSRTIHTLLRLFRKQPKPDSDKRENLPFLCTTHIRIARERNMPYKLFYIGNSNE
ncbi:hypothetical protein EZS27_024092, partial [termite gut metagenome]